MRTKFLMTSSNSKRVFLSLVVSKTGPQQTELSQKWAWLCFLTKSLPFMITQVEVLDGKSVCPDPDERTTQIYMVWKHGKKHESRDMNARKAWWTHESLDMNSRIVWWTHESLDIGTFGLGRSEHTNFPSGTSNRVLSFAETCLLSDMRVLQSQNLDSIFAQIVYFFQNTCSGPYDYRFGYFERNLAR